MLKIEPWTLFWTIFNVVVLFLALRHFLIKPVMAVIDKRNALIQGQFDQAQAAQKQADEMKLEYERRLGDAKEQAAQIITDAKARAEEEHIQALEKTKAEADQMREQAKADIRLEQEQAKQELQAQIADIAMLAARKIIKTGEIHDTGGNE